MIANLVLYWSLEANGIDVYLNQSLYYVNKRSFRGFKKVSFTYSFNNRLKILQTLCLLLPTLQYFGRRGLGSEIIQIIYINFFWWSQLTVSYLQLCSYLLCAWVETTALAMSLWRSSGSNVRSPNTRILTPCFSRFSLELIKKKKKPTQKHTNGVLICPHVWPVFITHYVRCARLTALQAAGGTFL